jgi:hypothetical protein
MSFLNFKPRLVVETSGEAIPRALFTVQFGKEDLCF